MPAMVLAQAVPGKEVGALATAGTLPDAPPVMQSQSTFSAPRSFGAISGTVLDGNGAVVVGAAVRLQSMDSDWERATRSSSAGFFSFESVGPGRFKLTIAATGFAGWTETDIPMQAGADLDLPAISLKVASATTDVLVVFSQHDLATEQVRVQEKQRVLGVFPNFYTSYVWNAVPLTVGQKFQLAWRSSIDWEAFAASAGIAGVEQAQNDFRGYGQGTQGFAKRFGASYADGLIGTMIGGAALPALLHQDPRYFYKGTGTIRQRAMYAIATTVICKGDKGHWQPNYSNVGGNLAAGAISNLYYPKDERGGVATTFDNALIGTAAGAAGALIQEFLLKKITPGTAAHNKP